MQTQGGYCVARKVVTKTAFTLIFEATREKKTTESKLTYLFGTHCGANVSSGLDSAT